MNKNEKLVFDLQEYDRFVVSEGLSALLKRHVKPEDIASVLNELSDMYGGTGLVSVMDYARNHLC